MFVRGDFLRSLLLSFTEQSLFTSLPDAAQEAFLIK